MVYISMQSETKLCQNCKKEFVIEQADFDFYKKMSVPPPTWCPECRMIRRIVWGNNSWKLFRRPDSLTGKELFSGLHRDAPVKVYEPAVWQSDAWDPLEYGQNYNFSRPFFTQFNELMHAVPWPSRTILRVTDSVYVNSVSDAKSSYLCFAGVGIEKSAYVISFTHVTDGFDLYESRHSELCYDSYMVDESDRVFFSVKCEDSVDIWFSKNLIGCMNCFGCANLRNKQYSIFNKPVGKDAYQKFIKEFKSGSSNVVEKMRIKSQEFWMKYPNRFTFAINTVNSSGEHIEHTKNVHRSYFVHEAEDLKYCQLLEDARDAYDYTDWGQGAERIYEAVAVGEEVADIKFSCECWPSSRGIEYSLLCRSSSDLFGCVGLKKKKYCILNKQYTKEEYKKLREKIIAHMNEMPYVSPRGQTYTYG